MSCPAKIRPFPNPTEISCDVVDEHTTHAGVLRDYAYPGSRTTIHWLDSDRRTFTGEWVECVTQGCVLPHGHRGQCAL